MKLQLLGTGGYHPSDTRHTACLLLPESGVAFDAGTGAYRLGRFLKTDELTFFLTHAHLDHIVGLTYLYTILHERPLKRVLVRGEEDKLDAVRRRLFSSELFPSMPPLEFKVLAKEEIVTLADGGRLSHFPLEHPGGTIGYRVDWPAENGASAKSMAYVTDTTASFDSPYVDKIHGVDLLVHECYLPDEYAESAKQYGHSFTTAVAELARAAQVKRLVLTHIHPLESAEKPLDLAPAQRIFTNVSLGADLTEIEF